MDGHVGQHHTQAAEAIGNRGRQRLPGRQQHDGSMPGSEQLFFGQRNVSIMAQHIQPAKHHGKRFPFAEFASPQIGHCCFVGGVAHQMKTAHTFYSYNFSLLHQLRCASQNIVYACGAAAVFDKLVFRAAVVAGYRLCVEAAIEHVDVFAVALRTHFERLHGRFLAVVGQIADDGKAGAAVGAVGKRIIDAVWLVLHVVQAVVANGYVGAYLGDAAAVVAAAMDFKIIKILNRHLCHVDIINSSSRWCLLANVDHESDELLLRSFGTDGHPTQIVRHIAAQLMPVRQPINKRAETHALHKPCYADDLR